MSEEKKPKGRSWEKVPGCIGGQGSLWRGPQMLGAVSSVELTGPGGSLEYIVSFSLPHDLPSDALCNLGLKAFGMIGATEQPRRPAMTCRLFYKPVHTAASVAHG